MSELAKERRHARLIETKLVLDSFDYPRLVLIELFLVAHLRLVHALLDGCIAHFLFPASFASRLSRSVAAWDLEGNGPRAGCGPIE